MDRIQFDPQSSSMVLIGTSKYRSESLPGLPATVNNVRGLSEALTDPRLGLIPLDRCSTVIDPDRPSQVSRSIRQSTADADMILIYYTGHGFLDRRGNLYLGLTDTEPDDVGASALSYEIFREAILDSPARQRVVILDCCYSGRAVEAMADSTSQISAHTQVDGTYVLTSTSQNRTAFAPEGERYTAFTGQLINILLQGIPGSSELLSLRSIYEELTQRLASRGWPLPQFSSRNASGELYIARNAAFVGASAASRSDIATPSIAESLQVDSELAPPRWVDPGFAYETTRGRDMLGIRKDAVALAVLLASGSLNPPLAVGLYGNWGSGKTFFMRTLDREVQRLADQGAQGSCGKVASVWFNAWQYAEGNLWASLTHHIFLSLHDDESAPERMLNDALRTVQGICDAKADATANVQRSEEAVKRAQHEVTELQEKIEEAKANAAKIRGRDVLDAIIVDDQLRESLNDAAKELGVPEAGKSAREVVQAADDVRSAAESWRSLSVAGPWWRTPLALGIAAAAVAGGISIAISTIIHAKHGTASPIVGEVGQFIALVGGIAAWITRQSSLARRLMRPAERIQKQVNARVAEVESKYRAEAAAASEDLNGAEAELIDARRQLADAQDRETAARIDLSRLTGARLLKRYLSERANSSEYGQYLGAVALAHRDLRDLAAYLNKAAADDEGGPIDRIVLYIDDLDRCQPTTVVQVLESVNLLLSLPLFVVVVGVDARWLMRSLHDIHPLLLNRYSVDSQATSIDYLDKIFQLTYHLPIMTSDACAELLEYTALNTQPSGQASDEGDTQRAEEYDSERPTEPTSQTDEYDERHELTDSQIEAVGAIALTLNEEEMKALRVVAPLVGVSPRRAKRFLNIYRIIKARALMDPATYQLLTDEISQSSAAIGLLMITALILGLPNCIPTAIDSADRIDDVNIRRWLEEQQHRVPSGTQEAERLSSFLSVDTLPELPMRDLLQWLPIVRRFAWPSEPEFANNVPINDPLSSRITPKPSENGN